MEEHAAKFTLISDRESWLRHYLYHRDEDLTYPHNRMNKSNAILRATFNTLAEADQLRVRRVVGMIGLDTGIWYHEITILDQNKQVVTTLKGYIDEEDAVRNHAEILYIKYPLAPVPYWTDDGKMIRHPSLAQLILVLPIEFPNYPEFRDEDGNTLQSYYQGTTEIYYVIDIVMNVKFITDEFITKTMQKIRKQTIEQCRKIKEELMINRWSPQRVLKLLEAGYDMEDM